MKGKKKLEMSMSELTAGYGSFIKGKKTNPKGKELFDRVLKKAVKLRGSK